MPVFALYSYIMSSMTLPEELKWRGFVNQTTFDDIAALTKEKRSFYWGVDPSAPSMQVGNLAAAMMVKVFIKHGYTPILLVGGATGLIGDPDGKAQERDLKTPEEINKNKASIVKQYETIFDGERFKVVDNYDWFKDFGYLQFLREVGKHVPMRQMLAREFVQSRLSEGGTGISYAEFSYSLIQGYDFLHLFEKHGVTLQISGADQWGNCIAGVDLIRRKTGKEAHVWTSPLVMNKSTGKKFGKSEEGAVWLDPTQTSPYKFYQFWLNVDDQGAGDYLKIFTELDKADIDQVMLEFSKDRAGRAAQKKLAYEVTKLVHGADQAKSQVRIAEALAKQSPDQLSGEELAVIREEMPSIKTSAEPSVIELLVKTGLAGSNSEARQLVGGGAVYINGKSYTEEKVKSDSYQNGRFFIRKGKVLQNTALVEIK